MPSAPCFLRGINEPPVHQLDRLRAGGEFFRPCRDTAGTVAYSYNLLLAAAVESRDEHALIQRTCTGGFASISRGTAAYTSMAVASEIQPFLMLPDCDRVRGT